MLKRRHFWFVFVTAVVVGVLVAGMVRSREPRYHGRSLSEWVESYSDPTYRARVGPSERDQAILHFGTNAFPYLVSWMRYETPEWRRKLYRAVNPTLKKVKPSWQLFDRRERFRGAGAEFALIVLSPGVDGAIAEISKMANDPRTPPDVAIRAKNVLALIDPRSWNDYPKF